jgi:hypothetical protein
MKAILRDKYAGLSRLQLTAIAYDLGFNFEKYSRSCSQSTVAALHDMLDVDDVVVRVSNSSAAGQAIRGTGTCGGLIGGTMILDYFLGRTVGNMSCTELKEPNIEPLLNAIAIAGLLYDKYIGEYGTILCPHIQTQLYGRQFFLPDEQEMTKFENIGGHGDSKKSCCHIVGNASRWVLEILVDNGMLVL